MPSTTLPVVGTNLTLVIGTLSRAPERRALPSGDEVLALDVTVPRPSAAAESVPVAWFGAPTAADRWVAGDAVLVVGRVRRRFFRAGGATQSRTEVVATTVVPTRRSAAAGKAMRAALAGLEAAPSR